MTDPRRTTRSDTLARWWSDALHLQATAYVALGPRRTGKTTFFRRLSSEPGTAYWGMREGAARLGSVDAVRRSLFDAIGWRVGEPLDPDRSLKSLFNEMLNELAAARASGPVLIVDDWSTAVEATSDACYEVLYELALYAGHEQLVRAWNSRVTLVFVAEGLNKDDVLYLARRTQRPAFERLSGLIERLFTQAPVPFLDRDEAVDACLELGAGEDDAEAITVDSGGWWWLIEACCAAAVRAGGWSSVDLAERHRVVSEALSDAVLPILLRRPPAEHRRLEGFAYLAEVLGTGTPEDVGVPAAYAEDGVARTDRPAPLIAAALVRRVMIVDVENIRMPFVQVERLWRAAGRVTPYAPAAEEFVRRRMAEWIPLLRERYSIEPEDVWFCGNAVKLINRTAGDLPGLRITVPPSVESKKHIDDMRMGMTAVDVRRVHPLARVVVVAEDRDVPLMLSELHMLDQQVTVVTPWDAPRETRELAAAGGAQVDERSFPHARPPENEDPPPLNPMRPAPR